MRLAPEDRSQTGSAELAGCRLMELIAGDSFGGLLGCAGRGGDVAIGVAVAVRMAVTVAIGMTVAGGGSNCYRLAGVGEIGWGGFGDVRDRADLNYRRLRLLENELFIDCTNLGLFFEGLLAARAIFFRGGLRNVVFEVADTSGVIGVDLQRVFEALEIDTLAFGVDFVFAVVLVPFGDGRVLVHVLDDLAPAYAGVVGAEGDFALLRGVGDDAHFGASEVVIEKILEPHAGDEEEVPRIGLAALHGVFVGAVW